MTKRVGVTIGKFMPLHLGHELLIKMGSDLTDEFHVIVSGKETDKIPLSIRAGWVLDFCVKEKLINITVHKHTDKSPTPINIDEKGTVLDVDFQLYWANEFSKLVPDATHIVSSDMYGKVLADRMSLEWLPVDPDREAVPISGTEIRADITKNFKYVSSVARNHYIKKVAIIGAESTGKSTLTKYMAKVTNSAYAPEYGRTLSVNKDNVLTEDDFYDIIDGQSVLIDHAAATTQSPFVFTDSEAYTTFLYHTEFLGKVHPSMDLYGMHQDFDLYVLLLPDVKWVDDGTRTMADQQKREKFTSDLKDFLDTYKKPYIVIGGSDFADRRAKAKSEILDFLSNVVDTNG